MKETALITEILPDNKAKVQVSRSTACENCASKCMVSEKNLTVEAVVSNAAGRSVGEKVMVEMELVGLLSASVIMYGIPLILFFIGCFSGYYAAGAAGLNADICAFAAGIVLMAAAYIGIKHFDRKGAFKQRFDIRIAE